MKCQEVLKKLSAHIDEELDSIQSEKEIKHLSHCVGCQKEFEALRHVDMMIKDLSHEKMSSELITRIVSENLRLDIPVEKSFLKAWTFVPIFNFFENLFELLYPLRGKESRFIEEFNDFPPSSFGYIYFKINNSNNMRF